jgi:uncharacterized protein (DUF2336 family)
MFDFFKNLFSGGLAAYEKARRAAQGGTESDRLKLAQSTRTHQEILYYLAESDPSAIVRVAVARNKHTPLQAGAILAKDRDVDVRLALAGRLVKLLPHLSEDRQSQLYAYVVQAMGTLALDEMLKVRKALSSALKDHANAPPKVAGQLARDVEREVAEPILRFCAALPDDDMLDILSQHPATWALEAIATRKTVSERVSKAVIDSGHSPAGALLIGNSGARIGADLLKIIIEKARQYPEWHTPLAVRKNLPPEMVRMMMDFVDEKVQAVLLARDDMDDATRADISQSVRRRLAFENLSDDPVAKVKSLMAQGGLNEDAIHDALAMRDTGFVAAALALMAGTNLETVKKILAMRAAKPVCALCFKAGVSMRLALKIQQEVAGVPARELLYPKGGVDYPLTDDEIKWQMEFLGL